MLAVCLVTTVSVVAQKAPQATIDAFNKHFPGASSIKWEKEGKGYEVNFKKDSKQMSAVYNNKSELQETETGISTTALPAAALEYLKKHYKNASIKEAAMITKASGDINFEAEVNKQDIIFDTKGTFIKIAKD